MKRTAWPCRSLRRTSHSGPAARASSRVRSAPGRTTKPARVGAMVEVDVKDLARQGLPPVAPVDLPPAPPGPPALHLEGRRPQGQVAPRAVEGPPFPAAGHRSPAAGTGRPRWSTLPANSPFPTPRGGRGRSRRGRPRNGGTPGSAPGPPGPSPWRPARFGRPPTRPRNPAGAPPYRPRPLSARGGGPRSRTVACRRIRGRRPPGSGRRRAGRAGPSGSHG